MCIEPYPNIVIFGTQTIKYKQRIMQIRYWRWERTL